MSDNERDTHFQGFAKLLFAEIMSTEAMSDVTRFLRDDDITEFHTLIAQRAYDLAVHVYNNAENWYMNDIPDLTQWPDLPDSE